MTLSILLAVLISLLFVTTGNHASLDVVNILAYNTTILPQKGIPQGDPAIVSCTCHGKTLQEKFPMNAFETDHEDIDFFEYCEKNATAVCDYSRKCDNCTLEIKNCSRLSQRQNISSECIYRSIKVQRGRQLLKTKITGSSRHRRNSYPTHDCPFPSELKTAEVNCLITSKFIKCRQTCLFGYTLEQGISRESKCYYKEKKWNGGGFKECLPFVDCTVTLVSGGQMSCVKNTVKTAPHCSVSCDAYEDKPAVPLKKYICTTEAHKWNPDLPHCVLPGSGFELVPPPRIRDHSKEVFEPETKYKKTRTVKVAATDISEE